MGREGKGQNPARFFSRAFFDLFFLHVYTISCIDGLLLDHKRLVLCVFILQLFFGLSYFAATRAFVAKMPFIWVVVI